MAIILPYKWRPRDYQVPLWNYLGKGGKRAVAVWHRRAGKDEVCLNWAAVAAHDRPATYWHMLPEASQARKAIWTAINPHTGIRRIDEAFPHEIRANTNEQEMFIRFKCGSTWQVVGSDNFNSLVGSPPAGVVFSEWALANPASQAYLRPILAENGGWQAYIYTPRGRNHGLATYQAAKEDPNSFAQILTADETDVFSRELLERELYELRKQYGHDAGESLFRQEYYCSFDAAIMGAIYGQWIERAERENRITTTLYDPDLPVHTAWDLGESDLTVIWFWQIFRGEVRLIDYHESNGKDVKYYCGIVKSKLYKYGKHYVPQDARRKVLEAGGRSVVQQAFAEGVKMHVIPETTHINRQAATRPMLDKAYFDKDKCEAGIEALRNYRYVWNDDKKMYSTDPYHDWASHASTALEIIGRVWRDPPKEETDNQEPRFLHNLTANDVFWPDNNGPKPRERY